jgi:4-hydroxy-tetrahydrodipicolinate synthase
MALTAQDLHGLVPAPILPMREGGSIDYDGLRRYVIWLAEQGPVALAINVDTGEGGHLSHRERLSVLEVVKSTTDIPCITGLHGPFTTQAVQEANDLKASGADGFLVFPIPAYQSAPLDPAIPVEYHRRIADVGLPIVLFQLQASLGGVVFDEPTLRSLLLLDGVIAIKEASFNALTFRNTVRIVRDTRPEITVLTGDDNFMFESFLLGADGGLLGFAAIMTRQMVDMIEAWHRGDPTEARRIGEPCQELADLLFAPPVSKYRARIKAALSLTGVLDIGSTFVREPLRPLAEADRIAVEAAVRRAGLLTGVHA